MQRKWAVRWAVFLGVIVLGFSALEVPAIADPASGDTLSEFIRTGIEHSGEIGIAAFISAVVWFAVHILRKLRRQ